jgi:hypothetical protein
MGYYATNTVKILSNRQIIYKEQILYRKINSEGTNEIPNTDSLVVSAKKYIITKEGQIKIFK